MQLAAITDYADLGTLVAVVARSPIVVAEAVCASPLPAGFDRADVAILDWISAEGRRLSRSFARM